MTDDDLDLLADLLAGQGTEEQVDRVAASPELSQALGDLADADARVQADLAELAGRPAPVPPPGFAERLSAALAAEPAPVPLTPVPLTPASEVAAPDVPAPGVPMPKPASDPAAGGTVLPLPARRAPGGSRSPWVLRAAAALFAVAVLGLGTLSLRGGDEAGDAGRSAAVRDVAAARQVPITSSGRDYQVPGALEQALPGLLGGTSPFREPAPTRPAPTGSDVPGTVPGPPSTPGDPLARLRDREALRDCIEPLLMSGGEQPLALDYASFDGLPALVVVLASSDPGQLDVFVVGAECSAADEQTLQFRRVPRP